MTAARAENLGAASGATLGAEGWILHLQKELEEQLSQREIGQQLRGRPISRTWSTAELTVGAADRQPPVHETLSTHQQGREITQSVYF